MKKIHSLVLAILLVALLVSCNNADTDAGKNTAELDPGAPAIPSDLDLSGDFNILVAGYKGNDFAGSFDDSTVVEYAIYRRNETIKEKYGVNITNEEYLGYGSTSGSGNGFQKIYTDYMSGNSNYDAAMIGTGDVANLAQNGILWDLSSLPHIDLSKEYWDQRANKDLAVAGKMFYTTGDIGVVDNIYTHALLFNKGLISSYNLESPYDLVRNNEWTLEKFGALVKQVGQDLDNNGVYNEKDMYGLMIWNDPMVAMLAGAGEKVASVNNSGEIELTLYSERVVNLYDTVQNIVFDQQHVYNYQYDNVTGKGTSISTWDNNRFSVFNENRVLFNFGALSLVE
ncbi:MAG: extracellular solute-binding protein, partial [Clostridia bacterium]|nr:extracellular solute-binding protein [Clostridia bacterium]